jgi:hypothetical protein
MNPERKAVMLILIILLISILISFFSYHQYLTETIYPVDYVIQIMTEFNNTLNHKTNESIII